MTRTAIIICPGRGTYNQGELGYLKRYHAGKSAVIDSFDAARKADGQTAISALDGAAKYSPALHTRGDAASPLIFAASYLDSLDISDSYEIIGVTGNSMGWYSALAVAGAVTPETGFSIANTMGRLMQDAMIGGQSLYPFVDGNWTEIPDERNRLLALVDGINSRPDHVLAPSIHLGGMLVVAGNAAGLTAFESIVEPRDDGRYPMRLRNHAAFHTDLQAPVAEQGQALISTAGFNQPRLPLIDGRGALWLPGTCLPEELHDYTLGHQVTEIYDFTTAIQVAAKTCAPDAFILTGPGATLGGAIAQALIGIGWDGITSKQAFQARQESDPVLISMGRSDQRVLVATA